MRSGSLDDDDRNGVFEFEQVLGPDDGLVLPADMLLSYDDRYMYLTNWFGNTVQQFDIRDPFNPVLKATVTVPHPNMLRLSRDNERLYVSNSLLTTWDNDPDFGPARNDEYGIWLFDVDKRSGALRRATGAAGRPWVSFAERTEEDHHRAGRPAHDALRPRLTRERLAHPAGVRSRWTARAPSVNTLSRWV